jgi:hypothetical protein
VNITFREISKCEVCGSDKLKSVLDLGIHPMCDDLVSFNEHRICNEYPIEILFCKKCNTAHQRFQVPKENLFPVTYHYRGRFTSDVLSGMKGLVSSCLEYFGSLVGKKVLDIGCNDGSLLDFFRKEGAFTLGIEPTGAYLDAKAKDHIVFNNFLSQEVAKTIVGTYGAPDFITFTNVFAHIENLDEVIEALKILTRISTIIIIENHYLGSVLQGSQFDTFYHEHPRTYSYSSFVFVAKSLKMSLLHVDFPSRYGGNIRVFMSKTNNDLVNKSVDFSELTDKESHFLDDFSKLRLKIAQWKKEKGGAIERYIRENGRLRAKAFPGRAAILIKLLNLDEKSIEAVYEKPGSMKIGCYLPGTKIPIKSDNELFSLSDQSKPILNLAWHIPNEIKAYLLANGYRGNIININDLVE